MKRIDEPQLESDLAYRFGYLAEFIGFGEGDIAVIHGGFGSPRSANKRLWLQNDLITRHYQAA